MPIMNGIEAAQQLRRELEQECPIIIALTANALAEDCDNYLKSGMDYVLTKPIHEDSLWKLLQELCGKLNCSGN